MSLITRVTLSLLSILLVSSPLSVSAKEFTTGQNYLLYNAENRVYKLVQVTRPWRLIKSTEGELVGDAYVISSSAYQVVASVGKQILYQFVRGIRPQEITQISPANSIKLFEQADLLILQATYDNAQEYYSINASDQIVKIGTTESGMQFVNYDHENKSLITRSDNSILINSVKQDCTNPVVFSEPRILLICDGVNVFSYATAKFTPIAQITSYKSSPQLIWLDLDSGNKLVISEASITELKVQDSFTINQANIHISKKRIFVNQNGSWELDYLNNRIEKFNDENFEKIITPEKSAVVIIQFQNKSFISQNYADYKIFNSPLPFNSAYFANDKIILYLVNGSSAQALDPQTLEVFPAISSWAKSSKIKSVTSYSGIAYLTLLNSSNKPNLYKSSDGINWTRITLPTKVTQSLPIAQIRELEAGELVEIWGTISTNSGEIAQEINYIQDETSGIQIYLNSTKGSLGNSRNINAQVYGEISSSLAKRIILESAEDITLLDKSIIEPIKVDFAQVTSKLAVITNFQTQIKIFSADHFITSTDLRVNFSNLINKYKSLDTINLNVISDYNSASKTVELWQIGDNDKNLSAAIDSPPKIIEPLPETAVPPTIIKPEAKPSTTQKTVTVVTVRKELFEPAKTTDSRYTLISSANISENENYLYAIFGFLIGLLALSSKINLAKGKEFS